MKPTIKLIEPIEVLFVRKKGNYMKSAGLAWDILGKFADEHGLMNQDTKAIGVSHDDPKTTPEDELRYDACITFEGDVQPEGEVGIQKINGGKYAIFLHKGPYEGLAQTYGQIFGAWLPVSGEKLRRVPIFELYKVCQETEKDPQKWETEIYIPLA